MCTIYQNQMDNHKITVAAFCHIHFFFFGYYEYKTDYVLAFIFILCIHCRRIKKTHWLYGRRAAICDVIIYNQGFCKSYSLSSSNDTHNRTKADLEKIGDGMSKNTPIITNGKWSRYQFYVIISFLECDSVILPQSVENNQKPHTYDRKWAIERTQTNHKKEVLNVRVIWKVKMWKAIGGEEWGSQIAKEAVSVRSCTIHL